MILPSNVYHCEENKWNRQCQCCIIQSSMEIAHNQIKLSKAFPYIGPCVRMMEEELFRALAVGFKTPGSKDVSVLCQNKHRNDTGQELSISAHVLFTAHL